MKNLATFCTSRRREPRTSFGSCAAGGRANCCRSHFASVPTESLRAGLSAATLLLGLWSSTGCSAGLSPAVGASEIKSDGSESVHHDASPKHAARPVPPDVVARSALPFRTLDASTGELLAP